MLSMEMPIDCAVRGLISAALSHVSLLSGRGSSCSQPLLAKRPSRTDASGRNTISKPWLAAIYIVAQLALAVHLFHGAWSLFQSLGVNNPRYNGLCRGFAIGFAAVVCGVNISFPIAVLTGVVGN